TIADRDGKVFSQGEVLLGALSEQPCLDLEEMRQRVVSEAIESSALYETLATRGFGYGPTHRCIEEVYCLGADENVPQVLGRLRLAQRPTQAAGYWHPGLLDSALQVALVLGLGRDLQGSYKTGLAVPFVLEELQCWENLAEEVWV